MGLYLKKYEKRKYAGDSVGQRKFGALDTPLNDLEKALQNFDVDRLNDMAECLFAFNNRHYGPIPMELIWLCLLNLVRHGVWQLW